MKRAICFWLLIVVAASHAARLSAQEQQALTAVPARLVDETGGASSEAAIPAVMTTVKVEGGAPDGPDTLTPAIALTQSQILSVAGTYGDFTRALQVLPGVVKTSDLSNDLLVRGGHPTENLFVMDGVEIPNINHFALSGSNGGMTSMVDTAAVGSMELHADGYDAGYSSRLSSQIEIHTRKLGEAGAVREFSLGIDGAGGLYQHSMPRKGSLLVSAHRSVMNLVTNDIGINGVPTYANGLARLEMEPTGRDRISILSLSGADSIAMTPCPSDTRVTSRFQTSYDGWRTTGGLNWLHNWSPIWSATLTASYSVTSQKIGQQQQNGFAYNSAGKVTCQPASLTSIYQEASRNGLSMVNYQVRAEHRRWYLMFGGSGGLTNPNVSVAQPVGELSPFNTSTTRSDAVSFKRNFAAGQSAVFVQAGRSFGTRWQMLAGVRVETFALNGSFAVDPRVAVTYRLNGRQSLHGSLSIASQLPPTMDLLSYSANKSLRPIEVRQGSVGMRLWQGAWGTLDLEAYEKRYVREPVSTEYPALMLANMVDTLGQAFVWLPLASTGRAQSAGVELTLRAHWQERVQGLVTFAQSRNKYRALDGVWRAGNYDTPTMLNAMGIVKMPRRWQLDLRESLASGLPYTPFDLANSNQQQRGIYDLSRMNALRAPLYNRMDVELERSFPVGRGSLDVHAGMENVLNRGNLRGFVWMELCQPGWKCNVNGEPIARIDQMGRYPVASLRYRF